MEWLSHGNRRCRSRNIVNGVVTVLYGDRSQVREGVESLCQTPEADAYRVPTILQ